ncbi:MAG: PIN domain-containing protein [Candidatus Diapherotrites archaeon]
MALPRLVVDANIIVSALLKNSLTRKILLGGNAPRFFAPAFIRAGLSKYSGEFSKRLGVKEAEIEEAIALLFDAAGISVPLPEDYSEFLEEAVRISPDKKDAPYIALALKLECPLWSQDAKLKKQQKVRVYSTTELVKELGD